MIFGDFNCPFSALASARAVELEKRHIAQIQWRAVEHDPTIPPAGDPVSDDQAIEFARRGYATAHRVRAQASRRLATQGRTNFSSAGEL